MHRTELGHRTKETSFAHWRHSLTNLLGPVDVTPRDGVEDFQGTAEILDLGPIVIARISGSAVQIRSTTTPADCPHDRLHIALQIDGECQVEQDNRAALLSDRDFAVYTSSRPYTVTFDHQFHHLMIVIPNHLVSYAGPLDHLTARTISGTRGVGTLTSRLLTGVTELIGTDLNVSQQLTSGMLNLLLAALGEQRDDLPHNTDRQNPSLIARVKEYIDIQLHSPDLSSLTIAQAQSISPRYLQKLFENEGTTATEWIRNRRLERCRQDLVDPEYAAAPIAAIGARWGLVDASYFSRLFKSAYGVSPREYRASEADAKRCDTEDLGSQLTNNSLPRRL